MTHEKHETVLLSADAGAAESFPAGRLRQLYSGGNAIDEGCLSVSEEDVTYINSYLGGAIDGGQVELEGDRLYITTLGSFTYLVSEEDT